MNLYWDTQNQKFLSSLAGGSVTALSFVLRDALPISLYLCHRQSSILTPYVVESITSGHSIKFGAKAALTDTSYLVEQDTWTPAGSGSTQRYEASLPLNGASLISAMTGLYSLALFAEFTTQDGYGKQYISSQFTLTIIPDVITGSEV